MVFGTRKRPIDKFGFGIRAMKSESLQWRLHCRLPSSLLKFPIKDEWMSTKFIFAFLWTQTKIFLGKQPGRSRAGKMGSGSHWERAIPFILPAQWFSQIIKRSGGLPVRITNDGVILYIRQTTCIVRIASVIVPLYHCSSLLVCGSSRLFWQS